MHFVQLLSNFIPGWWIRNCHLGGRRDKGSEDTGKKSNSGNCGHNKIGHIQLKAHFYLFNGVRQAAKKYH